MDATKSNKLAMYRAVLALLKSPQAPTAALTALPPKLEALGTKINQIAGLAATQALPTDGVVRNRDQVLADTRQLALEIAGAVLSYADEKQLKELAAKVQLTRSDFAGRKAVTVQLAQQVHDAAETAVPSLANYGVTAEALATLQLKIAEATATLSSPRSTIAARKAATERLPGMFKEVDTLLENQIDPLLRPLEKTNAEFFANYQAARAIIDRRGGRETNGAAAAAAAKATNTSKPPQ